MNVSAIITAAGSGTRMGTGTPKQFLNLNGRPVLAWSLEVFLKSDLVREIIIVAPIAYQEQAVEIAGEYAHDFDIKVVPGGVTRQESVRCGLEASNPEVKWAAVHDAARPFVTLQQIESVCLMAREIGGAILATVVQDTVKRVDEDGLIIRTVERNGLFLAQTPQVCRKKDLKSAYRLADEKNIVATDEAGLLEVAGITVGVVESGSGNIKITTPGDLRLAEALIKITGQESA
ncbi:MAG TPA: 2-C-methyl-D-erythritol 4-phosphate cytidylyltransferase [Thermodesulfobacteriaceae bacterium]|nr:2-C-methyl-D-erythritol 4-phosphate cytidylyltransferase [Thermodesulfobacteriaceae bacterium]